MSYLQVTSVRPSLRLPNQYNTLRRSDTHGISPLNILNLQNAIKPTLGSSKKFTELMKCNMIPRTGATRYQQCTPVCSFGGKGEPKNGNEASPWKSIENAMSSFKKEQSLEDVLRQQMEKQDYYEGGNPPGGGGGDGGGGGGGFGGPEDEGFAGMLDDILQATLAILALIVLYLYIIAGDSVMLFITDTFDFLSGKKGPRIRTIMYDFAKFYQKFRARIPQDPYWLETAILTTPTYWDSPEKYQRILKSLNRKDKLDSDSDSDENTYNDNAYDEDSDDENAYTRKAYSDDQDDNAYSDDQDEEY